MSLLESNYFHLSQNEYSISPRYRESLKISFFDPDSGQLGSSIFSDTVHISTNDPFQPDIEIYLSTETYEIPSIDRELGSLLIDSTYQRTMRFINHLETEGNVQIISDSSFLTLSDQFIELIPDTNQFNVSILSSNIGNLNNHLVF